MHIAFLLPAFHSTSGGGGAESYVSTMKSALEERGHRVSIIAFGDENGLNGQKGLTKLRPANLHWFLYRGLPVAKSWSMPVREIEWSRRAWSALMALHQQDPVDVVEIGETMALQQTVSGIKPPVVIRGHGNPLAIKRHSGARAGWGDRLGRRLQLAGIRKAGAVTAVSKFQAGELARDLSLPIENIRVVPNPISPALMREALAQPMALAAKPLVLYTGRIELNKGSLELLRSVDRVASQVSDVQYLIAGARHNSIDDRLLESTLQEISARDRVRLLGHVRWEQLAELYRSASVFVMPSFYETFGISVVEAMAFGLPVVATTAGGLPEVVENGVTGILVQPGDPQALSDALIQLLRDPDLRQRMGRAGQERVRAHFTVDQIAPQTLEVYESVRAKKASGIDRIVSPVELKAPVASAPGSET